MLFCGSLDGAIQTPSTRGTPYPNLERVPTPSTRPFTPSTRRPKIRRGKTHWSQATGSGRNESGSSHEAVGAVVGTTVGTDVAPSSHQKLSSLALVHADSELSFSSQRAS